MLREVIQTFATESAQMLRNIEQAIQQNDVAALHNAVHRLRGSLLQLAAPAASAAAADLETSVLCASKGEVAHSLEKLRAEIDSLMRALVSMASEVAAEFGQAARVY